MKKITITTLLTTLLALSFYPLFSQMRLTQRNVIRYTAGQPYTDFYTVYNYPSPYAYFYNEALGYDQDSLSQFYNNYKGIITRDSSGNELEEVDMAWDGNQWLFYNRVTREYDIFKNITRASSYTWQSGNWYENFRLTQTFSTSNLLLEYIRMDLMSNVLTNTYRQTFAYYNSNRQNEIINYNWNNNQWVAGSKTVHYFKGSTDEKLDSTIIWEWNTSTNQFVKNGRTLYDYNVAGQLISKTRQNNPSQWNSYDKEEYLYDNNNNLIDKKKFYWYVITNDWELSERWQYQYDNTGRLTEEIYSKTNNSTNQVENFRRDAFQYEPDSSKVTYQFAEWNNGAWVTAYEEEFLFEPVQQLPSGVNENITTEVKAYPNPFTTSTIIEFESKGAEPAHIQVADYTGRIVFEKTEHTHPGINTVLWLAADTKGNSLSSGLYVVRFYSKSFNQSFKLIKQ